MKDALAMSESGSNEGPASAGPSLCVDVLTYRFPVSHRISRMSRISPTIPPPMYTAFSSRYGTPFGLRT
ncbi:MAG: hypothetical protein M3O77_03830, partial [Chloroflexota bacterium]|nr:hypothetical protein [Chloroflexota bacterium]